MASTDATPLPLKGIAFRATYPIFDNAGALVPNPAGLDTEISKDGEAFTDATNEWTEIGSSGIGTLDLTLTEMNADTVVIKTTSTTTDSVPSVLIIYPSSSGKVKVDVQSIAGTTQTAKDVSASVTKIQAAVYDTAPVSGSVITLSNAATQTVTAAGRVTA
jgi:hypothetical protein